MKKLLMLIAILVAVGMVGTSFARDVLVPDFDMNGDHHGDHGNPGDYDGDRGDSGNHDNPGSHGDGFSDNQGNDGENINTDAGYECDCYTVVYGYEEACRRLPRCCL